MKIIVKAGDVLDRLTADRLVCAFPFSILRHIEIAPPFSTAKREVVSGLAYQPITRVYLQVRQRFWESEGVMGGAMTGLPIGQVQEHPIFRTSAEGHRALLESHARDDSALALDDMAEEDRLRYIT